jgi:aromatic amino acid transport protein AroP
MEFVPPAFSWTCAFVPLVWIVVLAIGYQLKLKRQGRLAADLG